MAMESERSSIVERMRSKVSARSAPPPPEGVERCDATVKRPSPDANQVVPGVTMSTVMGYLKNDPRLAPGQSAQIGLVDRQDTASGCVRAFFKAVNLVAASTLATRPNAICINSVGMRCPSGGFGRSSRFDLVYIVHNQEAYAVDVDDSSYVVRLN
jgi:hypothetical protein